MRPDTALRWSWMNILSRKRADALRERFGTLDDALASVTPELLRDLGCREETVVLALQRLEECDLASYADALATRGIALITEEDPEYPALLKEVEDRPVFLYAQGDLSLLAQPCIALVGTREMSDYGRRVVGTFVPSIVQSGMVTVSGLAYGIDAAVAKETLDSKGRTIAVLGHGMGTIYPKANAKLAKDIVESGGLLLAEFPLDVAPDKYTFPARNRIIAGLSLGTVVLEAAIDSGSLITAELALEYNRDVFAVPGQIFDPHFAGCHMLITRGHAKLVTSPQDVLLELGCVASEKAIDAPAFTPRSPEEAQIYASLTSMPQAMDDLALSTGMPAATLGALLTMLELQGAAKNVGGGSWVRS